MINYKRSFLFRNFTCLNPDFPTILVNEAVGSLHTYDEEKRLQLHQPRNSYTTRKVTEIE